MLLSIWKELLAVDCSALPAQNIGRVADREDIASSVADPQTVFWVNASLKETFVGMARRTLQSDISDFRNSLPLMATLLTNGAPSVVCAPFKSGWEL
jgi:hypothetical protein